MGDGRWATADTWPPTPDSQVTLFLGSDGDADRSNGTGRLVPETQGGSESDTFVYDPVDPVPTLWGHDLFTVPADRRALDHRRDILRYRTAPLEADVIVVGHPEVVLVVASTAPDTDFFARLIDEEPSGRALEICYGMIRARHRNSLDREQLLVPGERTELRIRLDPTACRFRAGHRIRLEITSSDFPSHDRNHNTGRDDLYDAELKPATQTVYHAPQAASHLTLPIGDHLTWEDSGD
jgi:putative CocE/NonD family hydrolase